VLCRDFAELFPRKRIPLLVDTNLVEMSLENRISDKSVDKFSLKDRYTDVGLFGERVGTERMDVSGKNGIEKW
jgi:hypothetical protein